MDLPIPRPKPIFSGVFPNYLSACVAANDSPEDSNTIEPFNSARWMARQHEMLDLARIGKSPRPTNLPLLVALSNPEFILDLGGGAAGLQNSYQNREPAAIGVILFWKSRVSARNFLRNSVKNQKYLFLHPSRKRRPG